MWREDLWTLVIWLIIALFIVSCAYFASCAGCA